MPWVRESKGVRDSRAEEDAVEQEVCACAEEDAKEQVCVAVTGTSGRTPTFLRRLLQSRTKTIGAVVGFLRSATSSMSSAVHDIFCRRSMTMYEPE